MRPEHLAAAEQVSLEVPSPPCWDPEEFRRLLEEVISATGMDDAELGERTGRSRSQANRWRRAENQPDYEPIMKLASTVAAIDESLAELAQDLVVAAGYQPPLSLTPEGAGGRVSDDSLLSRWLRETLPQRGYHLDGPRSGGISTLAKEAGVPQATVSRLVNGRAGRPEIETLRRLGNVLGYSLGQMLVFAGMAEAHEVTCVCRGEGPERGGSEYQTAELVDAQQKIRLLTASLRIASAALQELLKQIDSEATRCL